MLPHGNEQQQRHAALRNRRQGHGSGARQDKGRRTFIHTPSSRLAATSVCATASLRTAASKEAASKSVDGSSAGGLGVSAARVANKSSSCCAVRTVPESPAAISRKRDSAAELISMCSAWRTRFPKEVLLATACHLSSAFCPHRRKHVKSVPQKQEQCSPLPPSLCGLWQDARPGLPRLGQ